MELSATMLLPCSLEAEWPKLCNCLKIGFQEMVADKFGTKIETLQENVHQNRVQKFPVEFLRIPREGEAKVWNCLQTCCCHVDWKLKGPKCGAVCKKLDCHVVAILVPNFLESQFSNGYTGSDRTPASSVMAMAVLAMAVLCQW